MTPTPSSISFSGVFQEQESTYSLARHLIQDWRIEESVQTRKPNKVLQVTTLLIDPAEQLLLQ